MSKIRMANTGFQEQIAKRQHGISLNICENKKTDP